MGDFVPVSRPYIWGDEKANLCEAIDGGWISSRGPFLDQFERPRGPSGVKLSFQAIFVREATEDVGRGLFRSRNHSQHAGSLATGSDTPSSENSLSR